MFKKLSLRLRITLLVAIILISMCVPMTLLISNVTNMHYTLEFDNMLSPDTQLFLSIDTDELAIGTSGKAATGDTPLDFSDEQTDETEMDPADLPEDEALDGEILLENEQEDDYSTYLYDNRDQIVDYLTLRVGQEALRTSLMIMAAIVTLGIVLVWFLMKHALQPVTKLSNQIADIDTKRLNQPLPPPQTNDEIGSLTNSFNSMLSRIHQSFEEQKRFSATAAHELKTPLAAIMANIEVLEMDDNSSPQECREVLDITKENVTRMDAMVRNLLESYMQPDASLREECNIRQITQDLVHLNETADDKGVHVEIHGELTVWGSCQLLERALGNLISNAYRYNKPNGHIHIRMDENQFVIADTGIGMPAQSLEQLCEPFYRVDKSRSRELGGSGLGLAIAKRIFDAYQIKMDVSSELGVGSTFTLTFPEAMCGASPAANPPA